MSQPTKRELFSFTTKGRLDKSINGLLGIVEGIAIDGKVNEKEMGLLRHWLVDHTHVVNRHPFNELVPVLARALEDGVLDPEEHADITWLCQKLRSTEFHDAVTADLQRLHALVGGIAADGEISTEEMRGLSAWLAEHEHLKTCWPYDEIETLKTRVLQDGHVDAEEQAMLLNFFRDFTAVLDDRTIASPMVADTATKTLQALFAIDPQVVFTERSFCFTGASTRYKRAEFEALVTKLGGVCQPGVTAKLHYLVVGADGNPCWAFACYGRKVEKAVELRRKGVRVVIVHERDFHDAVQDA